MLMYSITARYFFLNKKDVTAALHVIFYFMSYFFTLLLNEMQDSEALTLNGDVEGAAGSSMLVLGQAAVLSVSLRCDLSDLQHRQLVSSDGAHQLPVLQPGEGWGRVSLGATVQGQ